MFHNRECKLNLHYEYGFKLFDVNQNNALLWQQGFDKLRRSADNNQNLLWLDFENDEGENESLDVTLMLDEKASLNEEENKTDAGDDINKENYTNALKNI